jgi:methylmalonyl-CoA mutase N-terminal domain/subunit
MQALSGVLGGTQSLHTDSFDEALALPTERAARIALRTQQVVAHETGAALVADPLGGSHYVEWMTDEMERQAEEVFAHLDDIGGGSILEGVYAGIEDGWFQGEIADAAYAFEKKVVAGRRVVVGVNAYVEGDDDRPVILSIGPEAERRQLERLAGVKAGRDGAAVERALARVAADAAAPDTNVMPGLVEAVRTYATVGEIINTLAGVFGRWAENPVI